MWEHFWAAVLLSVLPACLCFQRGAPEGACSSLTPHHSDFKSQNSAPLHRVTAFPKDDKIHVSISNSPEFKGFVLQARSRNDRNKIIHGTFTEKEGVSKTIDCSSGRKNTLTHSNAAYKRGIDTEWTPAPGVDEEVIFRATVVEKYDKFWTEIDSNALRVKSEGTNQGGRGGAENSYSTCYVEKGCFGYPSNCVNEQDCEVLVTYSDNGNGIFFTMEGSLPSDRRYMAVGISTDAQMGQDSVTECFIRNGRVMAQQSWNPEKSNQPISSLREDEYTWSYEDGIAKCSWIRPYELTVMGHYFNLLNTTYHILAAQGPMSDRREGGVGYHDSKSASEQKVNFTAFDYIGGAGVADAIKVHGTFMVTAWIGFVSLGILLARHFKSVWESKTLCGVKMWFALHRGLMILALIFVVIAFIVIFVYKKGWDAVQNSSNPHAVLGCIATAFGLFQPIMAAFRCSPDDSKRPIFNWLHWAVGNAAQIIAVVTIFFARRLGSSGLDDSFYWVMAVFVVVHCFFHFVFQLHAWSLEKKKNNEIKMLEMAAGRTGSNLADSRQKIKSGNVFRALLLGVYCIFLAIIISALYALIGKA